MFIDKYKPLWAPDDEVGGGADDAPEIIEDSGEVVEEQHDGPGSGRNAIRKSLEKGFDDSRKAEAKARKAKSSGRIAGGAEVDPVETDEEVPEDAEVVDETNQIPPPEGLAKEAVAEWQKVPPTVQAAVAKRLADSAKGVEELKNKYNELDSVLAPHLPVIRQHGHTPAAAVNQLFSWFQALGSNPDQAFPALAKSFGYDISKFAGQPQEQVDPAADPNGQPPGVIPPEVQQYIDGMRQQLQAFGGDINGLKQTFQQQQEAKTNEILSTWSTGKPYFEKVRIPMAQLIQSGAVPLKNGQVDLDAAYAKACWLDDEVRASLLAEQEAAKLKARQEKAAAAKAKMEEQNAKARRAGISIGGGAPGDNSAAAPRKGKGQSVRDSILAAREELSS